jgi:hypothetical protein
MAVLLNANSIHLGGPLQWGRIKVIQPLTITTPEALKLCHQPEADCARYDRLRRAV